MTEPAIRTAWYAVPLQWFRQRTVEQVCSIAGVVMAGTALGLQLAQAPSQAENERRLNALSDSVAKASASLEKDKLIATAPHPHVEGPLEAISVKNVKDIFALDVLKLRNVGRGNCYQLGAEVEFKGLAFYNGQKQLGLQRFEAKAETVLEGATLAAGESKPFRRFDFPLGISTDPQMLFGFIKLYCVDELGNRHYFLQPFNAVITANATQTSALLTFSSTRELVAPDFSTRIYEWEVKIVPGPAPEQPDLRKVFQLKRFAPIQRLD